MLVAVGAAQFVPHVNALAKVPLAPSQAREAAEGEKLSAHRAVHKVPP